MSEKPSDDRDEQSLVKLYMDLMGTSESGARSVFMYTCTDDTPPQESAGSETLAAPDVPPSPKRPAGSGTNLPLLFILASGLASVRLAHASPAQLATNSFFSQPLSMADAINIALRQNSDILRAQKDLEAAQGVAVQTRAIVVPKLNIAGSYNAMEKTDVDIVSVPGLSIGNDQNWSAQIRVVQNIYQGGRLLSSVRAARLTKEQSMLNYQTTVADAILSVQLAYYDVLLAEQQIRVQVASVELLTNELKDTTRRFDAGTVPRFNVLRAEVELANARPQLIQARNSFRIGKHNLANLLGLREPKGTAEDVSLTLSGKLEAEPLQVNLPAALATALERRTELGSLRKAEELRREDLRSAKAGYKPSLQAFGGYDGHNSTLSQDLGYDDHGWIAGVQMSWDIFDGLATQGKVKQATALHERALVDLDDTGRRIELEVRTAYSNFIEADEVLKSQEKAVEEAEEALRLARARSEAGTGTQLDVLSAQTARTQARTTQIQALHDYSAARARLERAVGANNPVQSSQP